jgi:hypothetical protein
MTSHSEKHVNLKFHKRQGCKQKPPQSSRSLKCDTEQYAHRKPTNIIRHRAKSLFRETCSMNQSRAHSKLAQMMTIWYVIRRWLVLISVETRVTLIDSLRGSIQSFQIYVGTVQLTSRSLPSKSFPNYFLTNNFTTGNNTAGATDSIVK